MEIERKCIRKEMKEEEKARREATGNAGREGRTQVVVTMEISRRNEESARPVTRDSENRDMRMRDSEKTAAAEGLEAS